MSQQSTQQDSAACLAETDAFRLAAQREMIADQQANLACAYERRAARLANAAEMLRLRGAQIRAARTAESALESAECGVLDIEMLQEDMELASLVLTMTRFAVRARA
jgi:hypothetical protein